MRAFIDTSQPPAWVTNLGLSSTALLSIANRTVLDFWLEVCVENSIDDVWIIGQSEINDVRRHAA